MSHVRRKRRPPPGKQVRKQSHKREWGSFLLILILTVSVVATIAFAVLSAPGS